MGKKYTEEVVNEPKTSETPTVLVGKAEKADELSPNPAGTGFVKQVFVDSLPETGEANTIYCVSVKVGGAVVDYKNWKWNLEKKSYERVYGNDPLLKLLNGGQDDDAKDEVNPPKKAPEKVFEGKVIFQQEPDVCGQPISEFIDKKGGITEQELNNKLGDYGTKEWVGEQIANIPAELPAAPTEDGTYKLRCVVSSGTATYSWVSDEDVVTPTPEVEAAE